MEEETGGGEHRDGGGGEVTRQPLHIDKHLFGPKCSA